jgi:hypothetical protein
MADTPEKKIKKKVVEVLKEFNVWHFSPQAGPYGRSGIPDIVGILPGGRFIAVEVKAQKTYGLTALQEKTIEQIRGHGGIGLVVKGEVGVEALRAALQAMKRMGV